jgi:hypothetical protein
MKEIIILTLIITIKVSFCLKHDDICKNIQQECKGAYNTFNKYLIECNQLKCHSNHQYKCNQIYCSRNVKSCNDFYKLTRPSTSLLKLPQRIKENSLYTSQIKKCQLKKYKLNKQNVCLSSKTCILVKKKAKNIIAKSKHSVHKVICPCRGEYNYQCENIYCTINDMVCDYLTKVNSTKRVALNFQICMNHNQTLKFI